MAVGQIPKKAKLFNLINYRVRVTTTDNTTYFSGILLSYDKHLNLVLSETEEFRLTKSSLIKINNAKKSSNKAAIKDESDIKEEKRLLGLVILRGETIISVVVEQAPKLSNLKPELRLNKGKGSVRPLVTLDGGNAAVAAAAASAAARKNTGGWLSGPMKTTSGAGITKPQRGGFRRQ
ncbi:hypothetical protein CANARDRAFT_26978 [[Candida] arabinofermentans NRRL YB-2248]|uniref:Sm protein B n=1 Tax=[Candida] arabinofermentans NRRL YB-2248 TaxID=983967 RepID=A0A1E4T764_9ASCO|nr:hypothetical protein CANARDRAFT_26978 [[Candida] arabinofermentans NRRL YB-2248]